MNDNSSDSLVDKHPILLVDDDKLSVEFMSILLMDSGYDVHVAHTVGEAKEIAAMVKPAVILCDINLPDGNGQDLIADLRRSNEFPFKAIALSGYNLSDLRDSTNVQIFDESLVKPIDLDHLISYLRKLITAI